MTKKQINELVKVSYTKEALDGKKVTRIAAMLKRSDLKLYIRGLKLAEKAKRITLVLPDIKLYNKSLAKGTKKQVEVVEDPTLLLGAKVIDNDMVYDMTLKNNLTELIASL